MSSTPSSSQQQHHTSKINSNGGDTSIHVLPQDVVDRIAAGEVVQRPASALKELLENSLDAGASKIVVSVDKLQGKGKKLDFSINDDGCGITKADLLLAATRFATSKLSCVDDFEALSSFGFRGEALASISMVSHLTITSRTKQSPIAFECLYTDGKPQGAAKRCARTTGTTVKVQDLFYNVPHRLKALQPKDEYPRMLNILQSYGVQVARRGVGIVCQQQQARGKTIIDLNTTNLPKVQALKQTNYDPSQVSTEAQQSATKQVIANIYGSHFEQHLLHVTCQSNDAGTVRPRKQLPTKMIYACEGFLTLPSLASKDVHLALKNSTFLLFVNDRYVECLPLKRQVDELYTSMTPWKKPPLIYLSIQVPPNHVDVNVHPTKTQVALLFLEDIVADIVSKLYAELANQGRSFGAKQSNKVLIKNPYLKKLNEELQNGRASPWDDQTKKRKRPSSVAYEEGGEKEEDDETEEPEKENSREENAIKKLKPPPPISQRSQRTSGSSSSSGCSSVKAPPPSQLVRTAQATPVGALEPFLVKQAKKISSQTPSSVSSQMPSTSSSPATPSSDDSKAVIVHQPPCPFATTSPTSDVDLSQPGAFAQLSQQCTCRQTQTNSNIMLPKARVVRPAKVVPTNCNLHSVRTLRGRVQKHLDKDLQTKLRQAYFVSVVSHHQSLVQWQEELCLINHTRLAQVLFYQLALAKFGGNQTAKFRNKLHVQTLVEQILQAENDNQEESLLINKEEGRSPADERLSSVNETNKLLAKQVTFCLWDNAAMLNDYFGLCFEQDDNDVSSEYDAVFLTGMPVLLDGHSPPPHGLPLFLLRLATEVNWEEERPCFDGVCRELGYYYAQLPSSKDANDEGYQAYVQHTLFPALSYLLVPSERSQPDVSPLTLLSKLYRVFERC